MASDKQSQTEWVIIGAGLQRTGTNTLKTVIEDLLGKRCYHMKEVFPSNHTEFWLSALKGEEKSKEEWKELLKDFAAGVDVPVCLFVKELMEVYPNAKVVLSVRDPEKWFESVSNTTVAVHNLLSNTWRGRLLWKLKGGSFAKMAEVARYVHTATLGDNFAKQSKEHYIYCYNKHTEAIKRIVPKEKLLIFDVREGYAPLCKFLGVPVREGSLPRTNDTAEFRRAVLAFEATTWVVSVGLPALLGCGIWMINSYFKLF